MTSRAPAWAILAIVAGATMAVYSIAAHLGIWLASVAS